ncbi:BolA family protein [Candidatus Endowatersipora endosymbiont of Watersipora subatra]|uniref:BolA family protein n=1 Tax=Candidatus Endowatersipora endosymbiont of Watersipora subatra TaxID=3077946 RepID=UPI00312CAD19
MKHPHVKGPIVIKIEKKLTSAFSLDSLEVINESSLHSGHKPEFNGKGESHIRIRMASKEFNNMSLISIHCIVNELMAEEFSSGLHALRIDLKTKT